MVDGDFVNAEPTIAVFYSSSTWRIPNRGRYIVPILLIKDPIIIYVVTCHPYPMRVRKSSMDDLSN
jgi:hypothetical protein